MRGVCLLEKVWEYVLLLKLSELWSPVMPMCLCASVCMRVYEDMYACVYLHVQTECASQVC